MSLLPDMELSLQMLMMHTNVCDRSKYVFFLSEEASHALAQDLLSLDPDLLFESSDTRPQLLGVPVVFEPSLKGPNPWLLKCMG